MFTKLLSLFLAFALLVPCFPVANAAQIAEFNGPKVTDSTEATEAVEETIPADETLPVEETLPEEDFIPVEDILPGEESEPVELTEPAEETEPEFDEFIPLGMPEDYVLSEQNEADRKAMIEHGTLEFLDDLVPGKDYAYGEILVEAESEEEALLMAEAFGGTLDSWYEGTAVILLGDATVPQAVFASLSGEHNVPVASPNYAVYIDPILGEPAKIASDVPHEMDWNDWVHDVMGDDADQYLLYPYKQEYQYWHDVIDTYAAWGVTTGQRDVTVAVIDSGVQGNHPDLKVKQYNVQKVNLTGDNNGHGTNVCGIIGATMANGVGGAGVAPRINLTSYRVMDNSGNMYTDSIIYAINQAANNGADVINLSLGSYYYNSRYQAAITYATSKGTTVVAAMGNDGTNIKCYPAAYDNVIAVAATDRNNRRTYFSNYGKWCDISAPGMYMMSTYPGSSYAYMSGTSQATPVVVGAIALYMSFYGNPGPAQMEKVLKAAATKCSDKQMGAGIVNVANMLDHKPGKPAIKLVYNGSVLYNYDTYSGQQVPCETKLHLATRGTDDQWYVLYTINGKTPSVKNGEIVNGILYDDYHWDNGIDLTPYAGTTITFKAMQVSGMGIPGAVLTQKIKVGESNQINSVTITGPERLIAGKKGLFTATVNPVEKADQDVTWTITARNGYNLGAASINAKGELTTPKNASGTITVCATSKANTSKSTTKDVTIVAYTPVSKMSLNQTSSSIYVGQTLPLSATMSDKNGFSIDPSTVDVQWTTSNKKIATVSSTGKVTAIAKGKVTITCKSLDGSGKSAKCTVNVLQQATGITITGNTAVAPGTSAALKVTVSPSNVSSKSVNWTLDSGTPYGVTISSSGSVKVPSYVTSGTIYVRATAKDGRGAYDTHTLKIQKKITSLTIDKRSNYTGWAGGFDYKNDKLTTVNLFSVDLDESTGQDNYCALKGLSTGGTVDVTWTSSNPSVASVSGNGYITAHKAGSAKITMTALDGSKKKATVTIKVTNPVSYMEIKSSAPQMTSSTPIIGFGKSVTNTVYFGDTYGKPGNTKVTWDYKIREYTADASKYYDRTSTFKAEKLITLSSSGKVTVSPKVKDKWLKINGEYSLVLIAKSNDGSGTVATKEFLLIRPATTLKMYQWNAVTLPTQTQDWMHFACDQWRGFGNEYNAGFIATSSNPDIVGVCEVNNHAIHLCEHRSSSGAMSYYDIYIFSGTKKGTATITIKTTDGSNKSCSFKVTVK